MHDAYEPVPILEKLPIQIECLAAWGECWKHFSILFQLKWCFLSAASLSDDWLLVGTKPGHLLLYRIKKDAGRKGSLSLIGYWPGIINTCVNLYLTGTNRFEVTLEKSNKNFSKKIQQVPF